MSNTYCTYFELHGSRIMHRWVDDSGERYTDITGNFPITLYLKSEKGGDALSIYGDELKTYHFDSIFDAKEWMKKFEDVDGVKVYGNDDWSQQFIRHIYGDCFKAPPLHLMKIISIDIEVEHSHGFPEPSLASNEVLSVSIQVFGDKSYTLGTKVLEQQVEETIYIKCENEYDLLNQTIEMVRKISPDVITGWNLISFDTLYLAKRINAVLGEGHAERLSPYYGKAKNLVRIKNNWETGIEECTITGVNTIDYLEVYKKFMPEKLESYRLDFVAAHEKVGRKIDYSEFDNSLMKLYHGNYPKFVLYNAVDNKLIELLEEKLGLLELAFSVGALTRSKLKDTLATVKPWDNLIYHMALSEGKQIPPRNSNFKVPYAGGYVKDPVPGLYKWPVTFDLTSLYPSIVRLLNMSPETIVSAPTGNEELVQATLDGKVKPQEQLGGEDYCYAINGTKYRRDIDGIIAKAMKFVFEERQRVKNQMKDKKRELERLKEKLEEMKNGTVS